MKQTAYQLDAEKIAELESLIPYATDRQAKKIQAVIDCGGYRAAARKMGLHQGNVSKDIMAVRKRAQKDGFHLSPGAREAVQGAGLSGDEAHSGWIVNVDPETGSRRSTYWQAQKPDGEDGPDFFEQLREIIAEEARPAPNLPRRFKDAEGSLLALDPADVHINKLATKTETGIIYNSDIAEHRLVEGCNKLIADGLYLGCARVLLVIGNDIGNTDNSRSTTTSGTHQDTHLTWHDMFRIAKRGYSRVIDQCLDKGVSLDLLFCPSNHDWLLGFALAQVLQARYGHHPNVNATDYNMSEIHRKYYRFANNLLQFSHGDGAKEKEAPQLMIREARQHAAECDHLYAYFHHYHHRMRRKLGLTTQEREKDHVAFMATHITGEAEVAGDNLDITYVRSPSAPDGWHHRNGYLNRQAVEAFVHHPVAGRTHTITDWF